MRSKKCVIPVVCLMALGTLSTVRGARGEESSGESAATEERTVQEVLRLTEELQTWLSSLPEAEQERWRARVVSLLGTVTPPAARDSGSSESGGEAIAAQPAPHLETPVAPAPVEGEPEVAQTPALEPTAQSAVDAPGTGRNEGLPSPSIAEPGAAESVEPAVAVEPAVVVEPTVAPAEPGAPRLAEAEPRPDESSVTRRSEAVSTPDAAPAVRPVQRRRGCRTLEPFDSDGDGKLTGLDRYWRHFYLWTDVDGDRDVDEREVESPFERGIREVNVDLRAFVRGKGKRKRALEIQVEEHILLDVGGDGWSGAFPRNDDGALAIDATAVRDAGGPDLRDARGRAVEGVKPFRPGWKLILADGSELVANCPRS